MTLEGVVKGDTVLMRRAGDGSLTPVLVTAASPERITITDGYGNERQFHRKTGTAVSILSGYFYILTAEEHENASRRADLITKLREEGITVSSARKFSAETLENILAIAKAAGTRDNADRIYERPEPDA